MLKGRCKTNVKNVQIRERACLLPLISLSLLPGLHSTANFRENGHWLQKKKEELFHTVIINLLEKENLQAAETDSGGEAGSSEK